ncbi:hypothetical protein VPH35_037833 [Triticum aestivum]|uniref:uncharacterized protein n=1 Tax=Triticum aestivum TaxID=4565 RepID=UPI001D00498B|nr:uncharacterized protein LOC123053401 [Triticum aestivum]
MPRLTSEAPRSCPQTAPLPQPPILLQSPPSPSIPTPIGNLVSPPPPSPTPPPTDLPPHLVHPPMETPSSTDPPTHAHQFWRWMGRTSSGDGWGAPVLAMAAPDPHPPVRWRSAASGSTCVMEPGRIGVALHTTPHRSLLLCWSLTTTQLRWDLDAQDPTPHPSFLVFMERQWQGDDRCAWWTRRWRTVSPSLFTSPPFDFPWTLGEREGRWRTRGWPTASTSSSPSSCRRSASSSSSPAGSSSESACCSPFSATSLASSTPSGSSLSRCQRGSSPLAASR